MTGFFFLLNHSNELSSFLQPFFWPTANRQQRRNHKANTTHLHKVDTATITAASATTTQASLGQVRWIRRRTQCIFFSLTPPTLPFLTLITNKSSGFLFFSRLSSFCAPWGQQKLKSTSQKKPRWVEHTDFQQSELLQGIRPGLRRRWNSRAGWTNSTERLILYIQKGKLQVKTKGAICEVLLLTRQFNEKLAAWGQKIQKLKSVCRRRTGQGEDKRGTGASNQTHGQGGKHTGELHQLIRSLKLELWACKENTVSVFVLFFCLSSFQRRRLEFKIDLRINRPLGEEMPLQEWLS